jgi:hypothetical protein
LDPSNDYSFSEIEQADQRDVIASDARAEFCGISPRRQFIARNRAEITTITDSGSPSHIQTAQ